MKKALKNCTKRGCKERGAFLVLTLLLTVVLISLCALVIDIGRLLLMTRQLQNAADVSALGGADFLVKQPPDFKVNSVTKANYEASMITAGTIIARMMYIGGGGPVSHTVDRGVYCYNTDILKWEFTSLEGDTDHYCYANAVSVETHMTDIPFTLARVMGFYSLESLTRDAVAHYRRPVCGANPTCDQYFDSLGNFHSVCP